MNTRTLQITDEMIDAAKDVIEPSTLQTVYATERLATTIAGAILAQSKSKDGKPQKPAQPSEPAGEVTITMDNIDGCARSVLGMGGGIVYYEPHGPDDTAGLLYAWEVKMAAKADIRANIVRTTADKDRTIAELRGQVDTADRQGAELRTGLGELSVSLGLPYAATIGTICAAITNLRQQRDADQARVRELEAEATGLHDRLSTIIDEAFGMQPVQPADEVLTFLEHGLVDLRRHLGEAQARAEKAGQERDGARNELAVVREDFARVSKERDEARRHCTEQMQDWKRQYDEIDRQREVARQTQEALSRELAAKRGELHGAQELIAKMNEAGVELDKERDQLRAKLARRTVIARRVWLKANADDEGRSRAKLRELFDQMFLQELDAELATDTQQPAPTNDSKENGK